MKIFRDFNLKNFNSYNLNAICKVAYFPENEEEILDVFRNVKTFILLGSGHNILLSKTYYDTPFVIFNGNFNQISIKKNIIIGEAGASMYDLSKFAEQNSLSGLEVFYDIPSSLGGAVVMNAGASGEEIKDVLLKVRFLDLNTLEINELSNDSISFEYRNSLFQKDSKKIVLKSWLELIYLEKELISQKMEEIKKIRWSKQPKELPNAGSVFKRPKGYYVGPLLDELNLKGYTVGGAQISKKHSGFIVNVNNATGEDILNLINFVIEKVYNKYSIKLEVEQRII
jgi:UDP-N-acetylmuramate dehydrogenase